VDFIAALSMIPWTSAFAAEVVDFRIDDAVRAAGGSNSRHASIEAVVTW
jgi:hypothetical protein